MQFLTFGTPPLFRQGTALQPDLTEQRRVQLGRGIVAELATIRGIILQMQHPESYADNFDLFVEGRAVTRAQLGAGIGVCHVIGLVRRGMHRQPPSTRPCISVERHWTRNLPRPRRARG